MRIREREYRPPFAIWIIFLIIIVIGAFLGFKFPFYAFGIDDIMLNVTGALVGVVIGLWGSVQIIEYELTNETKQEEKIRKQKEDLHEEMRSRTRFNN
ncbi:hypothetical protein IID20_00590 [Patescibacteria group bacterium]|nr:hypothetical protein [Patescibacteria group bacterium]